MRFELTLLGTSGGAPTPERNCSAALLRSERTALLIDCGENTQRQLLHAGLSLGGVRYILLTHLHGDHYFGLAPLLSSQAMQGRRAPLTIVSPQHLRPRLEPLLELDRYPLPYPLEFVTAHPSAPTHLFDIGDLSVHAFPLDHRIETNGYLIAERPRPANIDRAAITRYGLHHTTIVDIKNGADLTLADGTVIPHAELTQPAAPPRRYAHCSDTRCFPALADYVRGVDLLYHEATFLEDMAADAEQKGHATAAGAARTARDAGIGQLVLGHFSTRYADAHAHEAEARAIFPNTTAAADFYRFEVPFQGRERRPS